MDNPVHRKDAARAAARRKAASHDPRIYCRLADLMALEHEAAGITLLPGQPRHSLLRGRHASRLRGRGLDFEELRNYHPGDDTRTIDWRVTARTRTPHVRVFTEERARPALLVVDQRINMFFGTRLMMKSVTAAHAASLAAWRIRKSGDQVGAILFDDLNQEEIRPGGTRDHLVRVLDHLAKTNQRLKSDTNTPPDPGQLDRALEAADRLAGHDHLIIIASDFDGAGEGTRKRLTRLKAHNDVVALLVHDPSATDLPESSNFVISQGTLQTELSLGSERVHQRVADFARGRILKVLAWQRELGIPILPLSCGEETAPQLRRLLGRTAPLQ